MSYYYNSINGAPVFPPIPGSVTSGQQLTTTHQTMYINGYPVATTVNSYCQSYQTYQGSSCSPVAYTRTPQVLEESAHVLADDIITTYLSKLPNRNWLGKDLCDSIPLDLDSDKILLKCSRKIWQRFHDMDETNTTIAFYLHSQSEGSEQLERHKRQMDKLWKKFTTIIYEAGDYCVNAHPGVVRSRTMSHERIIRYFLLESLHNKEMLKRWKELEVRLSNVIRNTQSLIQDLPPPKSVFST